MLRATSVKAAGSWRDAPADTVVLEFDDRHRRRLAMTGTRGLEFLLDLPETVALRGGDALVLEDNKLVEVVAAAEPLVEIRADPLHLVRIAWHLGNRHLPVQIAGRHLRIRRDHVIEDMVRGLGGRVLEIEAPFDPEGGAYVSAGHDHHGHDHHHDHRHDDHDDHGHDHHHGHAHDHHDHHAPHEHDHHDHGHEHDGHHHDHKR